MKAHAGNIQIHGLTGPNTGGSAASTKKTRAERGSDRGKSFKLATPKALTETKRLKTLSMVTRQLSIMTRSGTPIVMAVAGIARQVKDDQWRHALNATQSRIEEGLPLADALRMQPDCFDPITCALVAAGEQSSRLPEMLQRLADLSQKQLRIRSGIIGAMVYPAMLVAIVSIVFVITLIGVVPRFEKMFASLNAPLPPTTQALVWLSSVLQAYWWAILPAIIISLIGFGLWVISAKGRLVWDKVVVRIPVFGALTQSVATTKIIRLSAELIDSHLPLLDVLSLVKATAGNHLYANIVERAEHAVTHGELMSTAFNRPELINPSVYEAIKSGEASGRTSEAMLALADFLEEDNDQVIKSLTTLLEPAILLFLGLVVAGLAVSLFLPLFDLSAIAGEGP